MADTSTYAKQRDIFTTLRKMRRGTIKALTTELIAKATVQQNSFVYNRRNARGQIESNSCTEATIVRHIRFCQDLGLVTQASVLRLSDATRGINTKANYDSMLETLLVEYLEKRKITLSVLANAIASTKTSDPETIYELLQDTIDLPEDRFRGCLNLLSMVGTIIVPYRKKMYLIND
jgi:hypothetical protein